MSASELSGRGIAASILLVVALVAGSASARADPPPPAKASLGALTFNYSPLRWRIEPNGSRLKATCIQIDCRDVVFDFSVRDVHGECQRESAAETAKQLFPAADRHPVNIYSVGRFGLVMAESWRGPDFGAPRYVFACLDWQDREYRFTMRAQTVGETTWAGGALLYLLSRVTAPPARVGALKLHGLELPYATDRWRAAETASGQSYRLFCLPPICKEEDRFVIVSAAPTEVGCDFNPQTGDWPESDTTVSAMATDDPDSSKFSIGVTGSHCRSYVPPRRVACAWRDGIGYRITSPGGVGCTSSMGVPEEAFSDLVIGARLRPSAQ